MTLRRLSGLVLLGLSLAAGWSFRVQAESEKEPSHTGAKPPASGEEKGGSFPVRSKPFELEDQHGVSRIHAFPRGKITILTIADQAGSKQMDDWIRPLRSRLGDAVIYEGVADLSRVPAALRKMVRGLFRDRMAHPIMLDWSGAVTRSFSAKQRSANLYVIGLDGAILARAHGPATAPELDRLATVADRR